MIDVSKTRTRRKTKPIRLDLKKKIFLNEHENSAELYLHQQQNHEREKMLSEATPRTRRKSRKLNSEKGVRGEQKFKKESEQINNKNKIKFIIFFF